LISQPYPQDPQAINGRSSGDVVPQG
jgi:hypothetical protein